MFTVYVIKSTSSDKIYIGQTENLVKRIDQHNEKDFSKKSYTKKVGKNWKLVYKEEYKSRKEALKREKELKSYQGRKFIKNIIGSVAQW